MNDTLYDAIIIGSGISGMSAGIMLAKEGENVLILEQHRVPGGLTQTYTRDKLIFPTGVHRIGSLEPGQPLWFYFSYLGLMDRLDLVKLSDDCFERFYFPDADFKIPTGHERCKAYLTDCFPEQKNALSRYFADMNTVISSIGLYNPDVSPMRDLSLEYTYPLDTYLDTIGICGRLKSVLTANSPLYGLPSSKCPLLTHFIISDSYLNSAFRINETTTPFSQVLLELLKKNGGTLRTRACAEQLLIKEKSVIGVILENKETLLSKKIIFTGHPSKILALCPPELFRPVFRKRLQNAPDTPGMFGVALKWKKPNCPLEENDVYLYDSWDVDSQYNKQPVLGNDPLEMVYLSAAAGTSPTDTAVTALTGIGPSDTQELKKLYIDDQNGYKNAKAQIAQKMMAHIKQIYPALESRVVDAYSPVTFERYTSTNNGSAYGIEKSAQTFLQNMFVPATRVKNMFLAGQSIGFNGIHGAVVTSVSLCRLLFGEAYMTQKILRAAI